MKLKKPLLQICIKGLFVLSILFIFFSLMHQANAFAAGCDDADQMIEMGNNVFE